MDNSIIFLGIVVFTIVLVYIGILLSGNTALVTTSTPTTTTRSVYYTAPPPPPPPPPPGPHGPLPYY